MLFPQDFSRGALAIFVPEERLEGQGGSLLSTFTSRIVIWRKLGRLKYDASFEVWIKHEHPFMHSLLGLPFNVAFFQSKTRGLNNILARNSNGDQTEYLEHAQKWWQTCQLHQGSFSFHETESLHRFMFFGPVNIVLQRLLQRIVPKGSFPLEKISKKICVPPQKRPRLPSVQVLNIST